MLLARVDVIACREGKPQVGVELDIPVRQVCDGEFSDSDTAQCRRRAPALCCYGDRAGAVLQELLL